MVSPYLVGRHCQPDFCVEIEQRWGDRALERVWEQPENLPTLTELTDPVGWTARVMMDQFEL